MRKGLVWAVMAVALLATGTFGADAQAELEAAEAAVTATTNRLESLLTDIEAAQRRGDELTRRYWQVESGLQKLDGEIVDAEQTVEQLAATRGLLRAEVRSIALEQYVSGSDELGLADHQGEADRAAAETLARLVVGADIGAIDELNAIAIEHDDARSALESQRAGQQLALSDVQATQEALFVELEQLSEMREDLDAELAGLEAALKQLEDAEARRQAEAAEVVRIAEARRRAEAAAERAAEQARAQPTPAPTPTPSPTATPQPLVESEPSEAESSESEPSESEPSESVVPNPQPSQPLVESEPSESESSESVVPNPQPSESEPSEPVVPNPQPSQPLVALPQPGSAGIVCPLRGAFTHTDDFNAPRQVGGVHRANDLISPQGTPVIAVAAGVVEHRESRVGGMSVHLKGDNGDYYFYTHLSGYENVGAGHVPAGTVVGYVGMTGNAPIPHLHFEIHRGGYGNYSNPYGPVRAACF